MNILFDFENDGYESMSVRYSGVFEAVIKEFSLPKNVEVEVCFVSPESIRSINAENRNVDRVTDVLSFPSFEYEKAGVLGETDEIDLDPETNDIMLGSIVLCGEKIAEQAEEYGNTVEREACYLFLHGLLHLLGFDHEKDDDKTVMRGFEEKILSALGLKRNDD